MDLTLKILMGVAITVCFVGALRDLLRAWLRVSLKRTALGEAIPWDGVGPERACLVRLERGGAFGWVHMIHETEDGYPLRYRSIDSAIVMDWNGVSYSPPSMKTVTHYAELPVVQL